MIGTKISAVLITHNADVTIGKVLDSLAWINEIVILDSGSTDDTLNIAKKYTDKIFKNSFLGFGQQKNLANSFAANNWVLSIDADEVLTDELIYELQQLDLDNTPFNAFSIPRSLFFLGKKLNFSGENRKPIVRLFNKTFSQWNTENVHESLNYDGKVGVLREELIHHSYTSIDDFLIKMNKYATLGAKEMAKKTKYKSKILIGLKVPFTFLKTYILKGAIFDGYPGFVWSIFAAFSTMLKYSKFVEMNTKN